MGKWRERCERCGENEIGKSVEGFDRQFLEFASNNAECFVIYWM